MKALRIFSLLEDLSNCNFAPPVNQICFPRHLLLSFISFIAHIISHICHFIIICGHIMVINLRDKYVAINLRKLIAHTVRTFE